MHIALSMQHFSPGAGGAEAFAATVCRELLRRGHRITVAAADGEELEGVRWVRGPLRGEAARGAMAAADVSVDWGLNVPARLHRLGGGTHREFQRLVLEACRPPRRWGKGLLYRLSSRHRRIARRERELLQLPGTHVLAVSRFVAEQVRRTVPFPEGCLHVLHNGVDTERFGNPRLAQARPGTRADLGLGPGDVAFLMVAHNPALKNIGLVRRIFPRLAGEDPRAVCVMLGRKDPGIRGPWFRYAGVSGQPERIYAACDVLIHPTFYDACANVVFEALAAGLAVVSSDRNGSAEVLTHGVDGLVCPVVGPPRRIEATWLEVLRDLARDEGLRRRLGDAGRAAAGRHTIAGYVDRFEALLRNLARGPA